MNPSWEVQAPMTWSGTTAASLVIKKSWRSLNDPLLLSKYVSA